MNDQIVDPNVARSLMRLVFTFNSEGEVVAPSFSLAPLHDSSTHSGVQVAIHIGVLLEAGLIQYSNKVKSYRDPQFATIEPTNAAIDMSSKLFDDDLWPEFKDDFYNLLVRDADAI